MPSTREGETPRAPFVCSTDLLVDEQGRRTGPGVSSHSHDWLSLCLFTKGPGATKTAKPSAVPPGPPVYLDLCYIPNHSNSKNVDVEFFKRVRSSYYVVSGNDPAAEEPSRAVLDALLEGKAQWGSNMQVRAPG